MQINKIGLAVMAAMLLSSTSMAAHAGEDRDHRGRRHATDTQTVDTSVKNTNLNANLNKNTNTNNNTNAQMQGQLQGQTQSASVSNSGNSVSTSGVVNSGNSSAYNAGNSVNVQQEYQRAPVNTAFAPPVSFSSDTCYAAASAGGQGVTFGLSASVPLKDKACEIRANARALRDLGENEAAVVYLGSRDPELQAALDVAHAQQAKRAAIAAKTEADRLAAQKAVADAEAKAAASKAAADKAAADRATAEKAAAQAVEARGERG